MQKASLKIITALYNIDKISGTKCAHKHFSSSPSFFWQTTSIILSLLKFHFLIHHFLSTTYSFSSMLYSGNRWKSFSTELLPSSVSFSLSLHCFYLHNILCSADFYALFIIAFFMKTEYKHGREKNIKVFTLIHIISQSVQIQSWKQPKFDTVLQICTDFITNPNYPKIQIKNVINEDIPIHCSISPVI